MVHDVARPVLNLSDITKMIKSLNSKTDGVSLGYLVTNAIKELSNQMSRIILLEIIYGHLLLSNL